MSFRTKEEKLAYHRRWYADHRAKGLCGSCNEPAMEGFSHCLKHNEIAKQAAVKLKKKRTEKKLCVVCNLKSPANGRQSCPECLAEQRTKAQAWRDICKIKGICPVCKETKTDTGPSAQCNNCSSAASLRSTISHKLLKARVLLAYGNICVCCGEHRDTFLSIDHIFNDGAKHRRELSGSNKGVSIYKWLEDNGFPKDRFQLLCFNCNLGKKCNGGTCPHVAERQQMTIGKA